MLEAESTWAAVETHTGQLTELSRAASFFSLSQTTWEPGGESWSISVAVSIEKDAGIETVVLVGFGSLEKGNEPASRLGNGLGSVALWVS